MKGGLTEYRREFAAQRRVSFLNNSLFSGKWFEPQSFVWFDRPGESSPEKDCCW